MEQIRIGQAAFPAPFKAGLEYSSPARGTWNIVHTGMLIPESHQIFVCALGCLRGVVLTAAEMNALDRYSSIILREENILDGSMEQLMLEGVEDVLDKLPYRPKAVLIFISCQHFFMAYDQQYVYDTLRERHPEIRFADCYMIPTLRKSGMTPDQKMRIQMHSMLEPMPKDSRRINLLGSNLPLDPCSELGRLVTRAGYQLCSIHSCRTFDEYLQLASASLNLFYEPLAGRAMDDLQKRLDQPYLYMPFTFDTAELMAAYDRLFTVLGAPLPDLTQDRAQAEAAMDRALEIIGETEIAVDYSLTFRILSFTRMLITHGFHVTTVYADAFLPEEQADFEWLRGHAPELIIRPCSRPSMRVADRGSEGHGDQKLLALGQKAAYFEGTDHFVNIVESGGLYGFGGIARMADLMIEAYQEKKDRRDIIQRKGFGCESCI